MVSADSTCVVEFDIRDTQKTLLPYPRPRHSGVPNFSRVLIRQPAVSNLKRSRGPLGQPNTMRNPFRESGVKRWNASTGTTSDWDGLRHDEELWQEEGNCHIHLYGQGKSKRGASFKTSHAALELSGCGPLQNKIITKLPEPTPPSSPSGNSNVGYELYLQAPEDASREDAFRWHLTTRNFFAWICNKPLVGFKLGKTMIDLLERMQIFRSDKSNNIEDLVQYAQRQGYLNFINNPDYALAFLQFAEKFKIRDLWINAFAHCVGMNDKLDLSPELNDVSRVTKALITRAYLEMDLHLGRVSRALRNFLEDELSSAHLGLPIAARAHLDRFRSFLHSFYVNKFGYWPPDQGPIFDKTILRKMNTDFQMLYDYLVDVESSKNQSKPPNGGICVLQNVDAFNLRHNYEPLPHALPLLPNNDCRGCKTQSQKSLRTFKLGSKPSRFDQDMTIRTSLATATNFGRRQCQLVRAYTQFEHDLTHSQEEKVSWADARKVRWIAVYSILQILINAIRAPEEVTDAENAPYHLCLLTVGTPSWTEDAKVSKSPRGSEHLPVLLADTNEAAEDETKKQQQEQQPPPFSIHPDCEDGDYFSHKSLRPPPLRINTGVSRTYSIRNIASNLVIPTRRSSMRSSGLFSSNGVSDTSVSDFGNNIESPTSKRMSGFSFTNEEDAPGRKHVYTSENPHGLFSCPEARTPTLDGFMLDLPRSSQISITSSAPSSVLSPTSSSSTQGSDDFDGSSQSSVDDRRSSRGIYNMDHESVYSDMDTYRKLSGSNSPCSPDSGLSSFTLSSAAAATQRLVDLHASSSIKYKGKEKEHSAPAWWARRMSMSSSPRSSLGPRSFSRHLSDYDVTTIKTVINKDLESPDVEEACMDIHSALSMLN